MLLGISGKAQSGKSTLAGYLKTKGFEELSFAAPIRKFISELLGVTLEELEKLKEIPQEIFGGNTPRLAMQTLGTEWGRGLNETLWLDLSLSRMKDGVDYVFSDIRFENEAEAVRKRGGTIIHLVRRDNGSTHESEAGIVVAPGDIQIINLGTKEQLFNKMEGYL